MIFWSYKLQHEFTIEGQNEIFSEEDALFISNPYDIKSSPIQTGCLSSKFLSWSYTLLILILPVCYNNICLKFFDILCVVWDCKNNEKLKIINFKFIVNYNSIRFCLCE